MGIVAAAIGAAMAVNAIRPGDALPAALAAALASLAGWTLHLARRGDEAGVGSPPGAQTAECGDSSDPPPAAARATLEHPLSGLPLREALLARMNGDGNGYLGALAFTDFEKLTAFDPALGERVFAASIARLRRMLPTDRFAAQVDRGHIGLWFPGGREADVAAELDAIGYALGELIEAEGRSIVPQVSVRVAHFDSADPLGAAAFLARTLASFALPADAASAPVVPAANYAQLARDRFALEQDLRQVIERRELSLAFQPLIDAGQGCVTGAEALLRWDHAERGPISPAHFIPVMESLGLASEIGLWVLNAAARESQVWRGQGLGRLRMAVNISSQQLERDDLAVQVRRTLQHHDLPATALEIELTESLATSNARHCRRMFQQLRAMGVKLAVDDFGTGYSGFSALRTLAFDKIKIDREFVTDVDKRSDSQAICQSIAALGRGLGIHVLAEGIERYEEYEWLRRHGCRHFQGFYFSHPLPSDVFVAFVRDGARLAELLRVDAGPSRIEQRLHA